MCASIVDQSIQVIDRRINELARPNPSIQRQGDDRILVEAPGLGDPQRLKDLVGQTAQLTFHMVQTEISADQAKTDAGGGRVARVIPTQRRPA